MPRGRKAQTPEQKEAKEAEKAQNRAADALVKLPADPEARKELFAELDALKSEAQSAAGTIGVQKKRMQEVYGLDSVSIQVIQKLRSLKSGRRECVIRQINFLIGDFGLDAQLDLFLETAAPGAGADEGSVFDNTSAGEHVSAERGDDPGRARKRKAKGDAPPAPKPSEDIGAEGLAAGIKPLKTAGEPLPVLPEGATERQREEFDAAMAAGDHERAATMVRQIETVLGIMTKGGKGSRKPAVDPAEDDDADLRPRFLRNKGEEPKPTHVGLGPDAVH